MPEVFEAEIYKTVLENLTTWVCVVDRGGRIMLWNEGAEMITGRLRQEMIGRSCDVDSFVHRDEAGTILSGADSPLADAMHDGSQRMLNLYLVHKDGQCVPVRVRTVPIRDAHDAIIGAAEAFDTLALMPEADVYSHPHVTRDSLTGILDEASFEAYLAATLEDFHKNLVPFGVLSISIDQLGDVRKRQGIVAARSTLRAAAQTLAKGVGPFDVIGRQGEEMLTAIVTPCPAAYLEAVALKFQRIANRASVPWWGDHLSITVSVGGAACREADTVGKLMDRSRKALKTANSTSGPRVIM
jgi:diguanylate cyclase (GGDEF)-like protein/PAS domain S-box-containing protein